MTEQEDRERREVSQGCRHSRFKVGDRVWVEAKQQYGVITECLPCVDCAAESPELAACKASFAAMKADRDHFAAASEAAELRIVVLKTKLTNLRAAAEHQYEENAGDDAEANADFWAAIEASR